MLSSLILCVCSLLSTTYAAPQPLSLDLAKKSVVNAAAIHAREPDNVILTQGMFKNLFTVNISIGTPSQPFSLQLDTGSSDLWVPAASAPVCVTYGCPDGVFYPERSSTFTDVSSGFVIAYGDGSKDAGDYVTDTVVLGGSTLQNMTFGLATRGQDPTGLLGIGYTANEASEKNLGTTAPTFVDLLVSTGVIQRAAYSLWLNDFDSSTGTILFGGIDTTKYQGDLVALPITPDATGNYSEFRVALTSVSVIDKSGTRPLTTGNYTSAALLDSGTTVLQIDPDIADAIFKGFGVTTIGTTQLIPCSYRRSNVSLSFGFGGPGGPRVIVPLREMILDLPSRTGSPPTYDNGVPACNLGISASSPAGGVILGDSFLRSAYVVYDLANNEIGMAQAVLNVTSSDIKLLASGTGFPGATSTATQMAPTFIPMAPPAVGTSSVDAPSNVVPATPTFSLDPAAMAGATSVGSPKSGGLSNAAGRVVVVEDLYGALVVLGIGLSTLVAAVAL